MVKKPDETSSTFRLIGRAKTVIGLAVILAGVFVSAIMSWVAVRDRLISVESKVDENKVVQRYLVLNARHVKKVLDHVAEKKDGPPPAPEPALRKAELELLP